MLCHYFPHKMVQHSLVPPSLVVVPSNLPVVIVVVLPREVCISSTSATLRSLVVHVLPIVVSNSSQVLVVVLALVTSNHQERGARNFPKLQ